VILGNEGTMNVIGTSISDDNHQKVIEKLSNDAKYFYMDKNDKNDFIIFTLEGNKLMICKFYM
jgi:hypothetical protein